MKKKRNWDAVKAERPIDKPAGHERSEALKQAADTLAEEAEVLADSLDIGAINPDALREEPEVVRMLMDSSRVTSRVGGYEYCWARPGVQVDEKLSWSIGGDLVWQVVKGDMPECLERKDEFGRRRMADVILLRAKKELYDRLQKEHEFLHERRVDASIRTLEDLADRQNIRVHDFRGDPSQLEGPARTRRDELQKHAENFQRQNYADDLATGRAVLSDKRAQVLAGKISKKDFMLGKQSLQQMMAQQIAMQAVDAAIRRGSIRID